MPSCTCDRLTASWTWRVMSWNSTRDLDLGDLRKGAGFGFRIEVPALGRVGFDVGYGFDREDGGSWQTHFQLGNTF